ncbi:MAG: hypothetical protein IH947_05880 [Bacteroidetes bacterium]|nr:hypothetical protein [Bacteroidota bacterium]MCH8231879.1 hypothetical protein [Bacteroidota bacterium]
MKILKTGFQHLQALSLDITLGGGIGALFIAAYLGVTLSVFTLLELIIVVWLIYTLDHLLDAGTLFRKPVTFRHKLHWENSTNIWGVWSFFLIVAFSFLFRLPAMTLVYGGLLVLLVTFYFISIKLSGKRQLYHKETVAAVAYAAGIFVGPLSIYEGDVSWDIWLLFLEYAGLALINLLIFSLFEKDVDRHEEFNSIVMSIGYHKVMIITKILAGIILLTSVLCVFLNTQNADFLKTQILVGCMDLVLLLIIFKKNLFSKNERYRIMGDFIFLIPVLYFII